MTSLNPDSQPPRLTSLLPRGTQALTQVDDDDCAVLPIGDGRHLVLTTDYLNASPICVELGLGDYRDLGWLLVGNNLADLCGTGARPVGLMVALTMPRDASEHDFDLTMEGVSVACSQFGVEVLGGDTKLGPARALCATAIGICDGPDGMFLRSWARPGQDVFVSGAVGSVSAALLLFGGPEPTEAPEYHDAVAALTRPSLPLRASLEVATGRWATGGTDLSDGLGADAANLARSSRVGIELFADAIPIAPWARAVAQRCGLEPWRLAFGLGGDYQFICTADPTHRREIEGVGLTLIGRVSEQQQGLRLTTPAGMVDLPIAGHTDAMRMTFQAENKHLLGLM
jgi:thiamine-monophosphate kinase